MDVSRNEAVLFDGYKGTCHILLSIRKSDLAIFLRFGEYDQEYSSNQVAKFMFSVGDFYDLCTFFPNMAQKVRRAVEAMNDCGTECVKIPMLRPSSKSNKISRKVKALTVIGKIVGLKV